MSRSLLPSELQSFIGTLTETILTSAKCFTQRNYKRSGCSSQIWRTRNNRWRLRTEGATYRLCCDVKANASERLRVLYWRQMRCNGSKKKKGGWKSARMKNRSEPNKESGSHVWEDAEPEGPAWHFCIRALSWSLRSWRSFSLRPLNC